MIVFKKFVFLYLNEKGVNIGQSDMKCLACRPSNRRQKRGCNRKIKLISQSFNCSFSMCPWMVFKDVAQKGAFIPKDEVYCAKIVVNITCLCTSCTGSYVCIVIRLTNIANPSAESILRYESTEGYRCTFQRNANKTNKNNKKNIETSSKRKTKTVCSKYEMWKCHIF